MKKVEDMDMTELISIHGRSSGSRATAVYNEILKRILEDESPTTKPEAE